MLAEECVAVRTQTIEEPLDEFLRILDVTSSIHPVLGVEADEGCVAHVLQVLEATGLGITLTIGRSHVSWVLADDVGDGALVLCHVDLAISALHGIHVRVGPGVGTDLVTFCKHTLQKFRPHVALVKLASTVGVASDQECGLGSGDLELVKKLTGVNIWAVIEGQGDSAWLLAVIDVLAVLDLAKLRTGIFESAHSGRRHVRVTSAEATNAVLRDGAVVDTGALGMSVQHASV